MPPFTIREVAPEATRPLRQAVLRPHEPLEELAAHEPPGAFALGAFDCDRLIAVGLVGPDGEPGGWRVRGMATTPSARGRGTGTAILDELIRHATAAGARRIWCNARLRAVPLYERAGMRVASAQFELLAIGPHVLMELSVASHLILRDGEASP